MKLSLQQKIYLFTLSSCFLFVVLVVSFLWSTQVIETALEREGYAHKIENHTHILKQFLTNEDIYDQHYNTDKWVVLDNQFNELLKSPPSLTSQQQTIQNSIESQNKNVLRLFNAINKNQLKNANEIIKKHLKTRLLTQLEAIRSDSVQLSAIIQKDIHNEIRQQTLFIIIILSLVIFTFIYGAFKLIQLFRTSLNEVKTAFERNHSGDFQKIQLSNQSEEFNGIAAAFNSMNEKLSKTTVSLASVKKTIADKTHVLELIASEAQLPVILEAIVLSVEQENRDMLCSILLLDDSGKHLVCGAAPSLPSFYNTAINGIDIGIGVGSCGTAAYTKTRHIAEDIQNHPYWAPYKELANKAQLGACWSEPIRATNGKVLGTFAIYHHDVHQPTKANIALITQTANLASIAIEKIQTKLALESSEERYRFVTEAASDGIWDWNLITNDVYFSPSLKAILGYADDELENKYEEWENRIHPDDKEQIFLDVQDAINKKTRLFKNIQRLKHRDGRWIWIDSKAVTLFDEEDNATRMIGSHTDISNQKAYEHELIELQQFSNNIIDSVENLIFVKDVNSVYITCNRAYEKVLGIPREEIIGKSDDDLFNEELANRVLKQDTLILTGQKSQINSESTSDINDREHHWLTSKTPLLNSDGSIFGLVGISADITEHNHLYERLEKAQKQAKLGSWERIYSKDDETQQWSNEVYNILEYDLKTTISFKHFIERVHPNDRKKLLNSFQSSIEKYASHYIEYRLSFPDGRIKFLVEHAEHYYDKNNRHIRTVGTIQDITERKVSDEKIQLSSRVFNDTHEGIIITDPQQRIVDVNPAFSKITGYSREDMIGEQPSILNSGEQSAEFYEQMWQSIHQDGHWQGELWNRRKQGELYAELLNISTLTNDDGEVTHYVGVFSDITSSKRHQDQLNLMAHYDVLTKLPNRALFIDRFNQSIAHSIRTGNQLAICFLDLDDFKPVNDNYGHEAGDRLLIEVAERITGCIREEDTVSRQGGDEFAILLNDIKSSSQYEGTLIRIHNALAEPYYIDGIQHDITASSGVTLYPSDEGDIDTLLRHADHAMYHSKLSGKHRFHLYSPDSDQRIIQKNIQLDEIEQALINHEFQLYYQPKVNMVTGDVFGVEALIRWVHPNKGLISPLSFLPFIDATPLEIKIGEWVINEAIKQLDELQQQGVKLEVSINISSTHLLSPSFVIVLEKRLAKYPCVNPRHLQLEILESSALGDINIITHIIETCQNRLGVSFSLDDFGTGYSSLTHLRSLPVDTIKIDQSFVRDILDDPSDYSIIEGVIALTNTFNRNVIAEGVESTNHGLMLILMGCEKAQGYAIAKPMPAELFLSWLNDYRPNNNWLVCGKQHSSRKENSLEIFKLITTQWKAKLKIAVFSSPSDDMIWPIIDTQFSHGGNWLTQKKQEQLFIKENLQQLENAHDEVHLIAKAMQRKYQVGEYDKARSMWSDLELVFDKINHAIILC